MFGKRELAYVRRVAELVGLRGGPRPDGGYRIAGRRNEREPRRELKGREREGKNERKRWRGEYVVRWPSVFSCRLAPPPSSSTQRKLTVVVGGLLYTRWTKEVGSDFFFLLQEEEEAELVRVERISLNQWTLLLLLLFFLLYTQEGSHFSWKIENGGFFFRFLNGAEFSHSSSERGWWQPSVLRAPHFGPHHKTRRTPAMPNSSSFYFFTSIVSVAGNIFLSLSLSPTAVMMQCSSFGLLLFFVCPFSAPKNA